MKVFPDVRCRAVLVLRCAVCGVAALGAWAALAQTTGPPPAIESKTEATHGLGPLILSPGQRRDLEASRRGRSSAEDAAAATARLHGVLVPELEDITKPGPIDLLPPGAIQIIRPNTGTAANTK